MSVAHFKGEVWSKVLLGSLPMKLVYGGPMVVNRNYEGEISEGNDTVHDQANYWAVRIDDVDKQQAAGNIQPWMEGRAAYSIAVAADQFLAAKYTAVGAANVLGLLRAHYAPEPTYDYPRWAYRLALTIRHHLRRHGQ